ncbi:MAG: manganese ABC transporter permease [Anaerolineaceae bacterium 4572_78]|nr:MAG: manganese ABC transporter permease [Anaerolineaceae bacterium 4572_78]
MINLITEPLQYAFMVRGMIAGVIVGSVCAVLGVYIVLRGMALFGNALSHAILPGVAVGYLVGGNNQTWLFIGGLVAGILTSIGIGSISKGGLKEDTATGVIFTGMFALGIALISTVRNYSVDLTHFLFGNVLGVSDSDLWLIGICGCLVILTIFAFYKELLVISFDPLLAKTLHLPINFLNYLLLVLIAVTIVLSLQTVGIALMSAMLVTPAATAYLVTRRLPIMMVLSALCGSVSAIVGLYLSFYVNIASGPAIVLVCTSFFIITFLLSHHRGVIRKVSS